MSAIFSRYWFLISLSMVILAGSATAAEDDGRLKAFFARVDELYETCNRPDLPGSDGRKKTSRTVKWMNTCNA